MGVQVSLSAHTNLMDEGIIMYSTFKRIISKHTSPEDIVAWKGFLIGILLAMFTIGPLVTLALIFIFNEHTDIDEIIVEYLNHFVRVILGYKM